MTIRNLQHFALAVPEPDAGRKFYTDFGLEAHEQGNRVVLRCAGRAQDQVLLCEGERKRLHHLAFGTGEAGLAELQERLRRERVRLVDAPKGCDADGLWFHDPDEILVHVRVAQAAPWRTEPQWTLNTPGHFVRLGRPGCPPRDVPVQPTRLGHVLRFTPQIERMLDFYIRVVGLKLSDRAGDIVAFLHTHGGSDHHVLAFLSADRPGFHHASFEVANVDDVGMGACRMLDKGYGDGWGFGRHVIGSNFFHYIRDPWMSLAEYFCDIDYIPAEMDWQPTDYAPEEALYAWGPKPPETFAVNFETAQAL